MAGDLEIIHVSNQRDWHRFVKFPYKHYRDYPSWVPPLLVDQKDLLNPKKHPFYRHAKVQFYLAGMAGKIVGRIAAIIDHEHNTFHEEKTGFFGFFECINKLEVSQALFNEARNWLKLNGMTHFRGPVNPSQNDTCGLLIDDFDSPPVLMMTYNPPYYMKLIEHFGLKKAMDLYAYYIDNEMQPPEKLIRVAELKRKKQNVVIRPVNMKKYNDEINKVRFVYNNAWSKNWGFVPMTEAEFDHLAANLKQAIVPDLALLAEINGEPVGFSLALPDVNQALIHTNGRLFPTGLLKILHHTRKIDMIRIIIMGVIHDYRHLGIDALFYLDTWRNAVARGYMKGEMSWILDNNHMMNRSAEMLGGRVYKTYRMYEMKI